MKLMRSSKFVLTDSGGLQEETTALGIPCLTLRMNTERPITIWQGTNKLIDPDDIEREINKIQDGEGKQGECPPLWDGNAAARILRILEQILDRPHGTASEDASMSRNMACATRQLQDGVDRQGHARLCATEVRR